MGTCPTSHTTQTAKRDMTKFQEPPPFGPLPALGHRLPRIRSQRGGGVVRNYPLPCRVRDLRPAVFSIVCSPYSMFDNTPVIVAHSVPVGVTSFAQYSPGSACLWLGARRRACTRATQPLTDRACGLDRLPAATSSCHLACSKAHRHFQASSQRPSMLTRVGRGEHRGRWGREDCHAAHHL